MDLNARAVRDPSIMDGGDRDLAKQSAHAARTYLKENSPLHSDEGRKLQARLLRDAATEIDKWRLEAQQLYAYKDHTERMLALFEAQPRRSPGDFAGEEPDIAYRLRTCAEGFEQPPKEV